MASAGKGLFDPVVINAGELQTQDLNRYDCVVVCDVSVITPQEARVFAALDRCPKVLCAHQP